MGRGDSVNNNGDDIAYQMDELEDLINENARLGVINSNLSYASKKIRKLKTKTYFTKKVLRCHSIPSTLSGSLLKLVDSAHKSTRLSYSHEPRFSASSFGRTSPA